MTKLKLATGWIVLFIFAQSCSHSPTAERELASRREAAQIYEYKGLLKAPPARWLLSFVGEKMLKSYLKKLPLEPQVRERIFTNLDSEKFSQYFVPFILGMKDLYIASKKSKKNGFQQYVMEQFPDAKKIPGLEHSLFSYNPKKSPESDSVKGDEAEELDETKDSSHEATVIACIVSILDAVFLTEEEFSLKSAPKTTNTLVDLVAPITQKLMDSVKATLDPNSPAYPSVEGMASSMIKVRATGTVLIDAVHYMAYKHYQMFAQRYSRKIELRDEFAQAYQKDPGALARRFKSEVIRKKYAVQILVDGLEGNLVESLARGTADSPLLQQVHRDKQNRETFRPRVIPHRTLEDTHDSFFENFMKKDGFRHHAYLPFLKNLYTHHVNGIVQQGNTTTPTISARNVPIIQTGAPAAGIGATHLVNMHFIDRAKDRAYYFFGNDAMLQSKLAAEGGMQTLAERFPEMETLNCMGTFEAGYRWSIDPMFNITIGEKVRDFGEILCMRELQRRSDNQQKLNELKQKFYERVKAKKTKKLDRLLDQIASLENESLPQLLTFFFPWPDHFAHFKGVVSDEIISPSGELNRLDYWLGRLDQIYKEAGVHPRTLFAMAGDHGLTPVRYLLNPEKAVFGTMMEEGIELKLNKISSDEGEGPKLTDPIHPPTQKGFDAVVASTAGGNYLVDFFVDQGDHWARQPIYQELTRYRLLSGREVNMIEESIRRLDTTLDFLIVREETCTVAQGAVRAVGLRDGKRSDAVITRRGSKVFYESERDLLEIRRLNPYSATEYSPAQKARHASLLKKCEGVSKANPSSWCNEDEWRELTSYSPRPDSVVQLARLYDTDLAGTMNLFPAPYVGFNSLVPGRHAGELYMEKDAFIGFWGRPVQNKTRIRSAVNGAIGPTIYEYLSGKKSGGAENGWGYRSLFEY